MAVFELFIILLLSVTVLCLLRRAHYTTRKLQDIKELIRSFLKGDLKKRLYLQNRDDLSEIALLLNRLAEEYEQKIAEASLQRERFLSILGSLPDAVALVNRDERIEVVNSVFTGLIGSPENSLTGRRFTEVLRIPEVLTAIESSLKNRTSSTTEFYKDDTERYYEAIVCPVSSEDRFEDPPSLVVIIRDITEIKKSDKIRRDFVANVSHELKTPLTTIKGYTETLLEGALLNRKDAEEFLQTILNHTLRMERLICDLINLSRLESGAFTLELQPVNLNRVISETIDTFNDRVKAKNLKLKLEMPEQDIMILADQLRIIQILQNLLDNAIKFTDSGTITIRVVQDSNGTVFLEIQDTGIGIPRYALSRLGERFFRVDPSRSRTLGGTGLGLAIVKQLVKLHGWSLKFKSREGMGTTVRITIPSVAAVR